MTGTCYWCHTSASKLLLCCNYEILVLTHFLNNCIHVCSSRENRIWRKNATVTSGFVFYKWKGFIFDLKSNILELHYYLNVFNKVVLQIVHKFLAGERVFHLLSHLWVGNKDGQHFRHMRKDTWKCNKVVKKTFKKHTFPKDPFFVQENQLRS